MSGSSNQSPRDSIVTLFDTFRDEIDDFNDRRERLIKSSRDVTNLSKKIIFLLHRIMNEESSVEDNNARGLRAASKAKDKLAEVRKVFSEMREELAGDRFWRYQRTISPGVQEYIEALSFAHHLEHGTLITYDEVQSSLSGSDGVPYFVLPTEDYLLGLSDLTGELMRYAVSSISRRGGRSKAAELRLFVRNCHADFEGLTPYVRDLRKKQAVTAQSLQKIEDVAYAIMVRSSEYDLPPEILDDIVERTVSNSRFTDKRSGQHRLEEGHDDDDD